MRIKHSRKIQNNLTEKENPEGIIFKVKERRIETQSSWYDCFWLIILNYFADF